MILPFEGKIPTVNPTVFQAPGTFIIGDVVIGKNSSIWYNAVIRGDVNYIRIGEATNIQDGSLLHVRAEYPLIIGSHVTLGHGVIAHACTIDDYSLIGMGATILDNAKVNSYTLVAAGSVVKNNAIIPEGVLVAGVPAKIIRELTAAERASIEESAKHYVQYAQSYKSQSQ
ncbi:MAG TPA: gamma carbonic anhydrase family protein [Bacteroidota bacterium]|nr:gamma carbonic anhydrase family protein [Bacteroidota bacterium]